jgi:prenyltransferase beta subunit
VGKLPDSCYSFWVGGSICMLTGKNLLHAGVENFVRLCFKPNECSFSKYPTNESGDPVHTLHAITGIKIARNQHSSINLERGISRPRE